MYYIFFFLFKISCIHKVSAIFFAVDHNTHTHTLHSIAHMHTPIISYVVPSSLSYAPLKKYKYWLLSSVTWRTVNCTKHVNRSCDGKKAQNIKLHQNIKVFYYVTKEAPLPALGNTDYYYNTIPVDAPLV